MTHHEKDDIVRKKQEENKMLIKTIGMIVITICYLIFVFFHVWRNKRQITISFIDMIYECLLVWYLFHLWEQNKGVSIFIFIIFIIWAVIEGRMLEDNDEKMTKEDDE